MHLFLFGLIFLAAGYFIYGSFVERILGPDDRPTPAVAKGDGVDFVVLPKWKNSLIQLLNIAGIGPVIGVILGIKFGSAVFLIIPIGCVVGGAVHDYVAGMMSLRAGGANLPTLVRANLGKFFSFFFTVLVAVLLILVVTVFINVPANLTNGLLKTPVTAAADVNTAGISENGTAAETAEGIPAAESKTVPNVLVQKTASCLKAAGISDLPPEKINFFWPIVVLIFLYYIAATLFPVDAIIGRFYPFFGAILLVGTGAIFAALLLYGNKYPDFLAESPAFSEYAASKMPPIIPCLFVTIACGILSGFHATQAPIIARTMATEQEAKFDFYGMMIAEGMIAMIWAAGALAIYNMLPEYLDKSGTDTLSEITGFFLGKGLGGVTIAAVIILAVTSGDTALRCLRLSIAEVFHIPQKSFSARLCVVFPFILVITVLLFWSNGSPKSFNELWNYFAWENQILASVTLIAATVWLKQQGKNFWITLIPGVFMTFIVTTFILWTSKAHGGPAGFGLELHISSVIGAIFAFFAGIAAYRLGSKKQTGTIE